MHAKFGTRYHWIPEVYRRMGLPVFEGVQEALERQRAAQEKVRKGADNSCEKEEDTVKKDESPGGP